MAQLVVYDLCSDTAFGRQLESALKTHAMFRNIEAEPQPGTHDAEVRSRLQDLLQICHHPNRGSGLGTLNGGQFIDSFHQRLLGRLQQGLMTLQDVFGSQRVILVDEDIFSDETNWMFGLAVDAQVTIAGQVQPPLKTLILSRARLRTAEMQYDMFCHELGHMFGAPSEDRDNTEKNLGTHCTNALCVMQQSLSVEALRRLSEARVQASAPAFCSQCRMDLLRAAAYDNDLPPHVMRQLGH